MSWFDRVRTSFSNDSQKIDIPDGQWQKCPKCSEIIHVKQLELNKWVCTKCKHHFRIGSDEFIKIIFDKNTFKEYNSNLTSGDPLSFTDTKAYKDRVKNSIKKSGLNDAVKTGVGEINGKKLAFAGMDFRFIGGSMGSVVGEKIARIIDVAHDERIPLIIISQSGGARMMEGAFSLMQMAKTSSRLAKLAEAKVPYISFLTDPTTGGTTASYAMLGDVIIAEPKALIGFAGPRVIKQTIGKDLPEGFQSAEFLLEHGFLDFIVERTNLKNKLDQLLNYLCSE